jgi:hypothetical protein
MPIEMSIQQASEYFNVSAQTVRRRLNTGQLLGKKVKGRWVIKVDTSVPPLDEREQGREDSAQDIDEVSTDSILKLQQEIQRLIVQFQNEKTRLINQQKQEGEENAKFIAQVEAENKGLRGQLERTEIAQTRFEAVVLELKEQIDQVKLKLDYISPDKMTLRQQKQILKSNIFKI